jgi:hypothetical protein
MNMGDGTYTATETGIFLPAQYKTLYRVFTSLAYLMFMLRRYNILRNILIHNLQKKCNKNNEPGGFRYKESKKIRYV